MKSNTVLFTVVAVIGLVVGASYAWFTRAPQPAAQPESAALVSPGDQRPTFRHGDLNGQWVSAEDFDGQVLLVNFWATWCAPCRREMPVLQAASEANAGRMSVVGIAIDEPGAVRSFVEELGISYPILVGSADVINTQRAWGNASGALPYTVLVDAEGVIRWQHHGEVSAEELDQQLANWL